MGSMGDPSELVTPRDGYTYRRIEDIPQSTEAIRRKVMTCVSAVERETDIFMDRYMKNIGDSSRFQGFIQLLCDKTDRDVNSLDDFKDLDPLLLRIKSDPEVVQMAEYNPVRRMVERGKMFEYISFSLKTELQECYEKWLRKYCLSFIAEAKGVDIRVPAEYESRVMAWDKEIDERLELVDSLLDEFDKHRAPLTVYLSRYTQLVKLMEDACSAMVTATDPIKRWVSADSTYARRVQEEISALNRRKMDMKDVIKQLEDEQNALGQKLKKRSFYKTKMDRLLSEAKDEKRYFRRRESYIRQSYDTLARERHKKAKELEEVSEQITSRRESSTQVYNYLVSVREALRDHLRRMDQKLELQEMQITNLQKEQNRVAKEISNINNDVDNANKGHDQALGRLEKAMEQIKACKEDMSQIDGKVLALKRIREIKLHSDTVKKIFHYGYNPGQMTDYKDEMTEAFKITADGIGKDWVWLYQKLPFIPPRDFRERSHDIEVIDLSNRRLDMKFQDLATKALEKWRRLSQNASVGDLVNTLKKIKKTNVARKIQEHLAIMNT